MSPHEWKPGIVSQVLFLVFSDISLGDNSFLSVFTHWLSKDSACWYSYGILGDSKSERVVTSLFRKPEASNTGLNAKSYHPRHTIQAIPYGEYVRTKRACSNPMDLNKKFNDLEGRLQKQGYGKCLLKTTSERIKTHTRESLLIDKRINDNS